MEIKFLKAGSGDSILIKHDKKNILIDGGNDSNYLIDEYNKIVNDNQKIDLLIVTHHDDDHIKGILDLFKYLKNKNENPKIQTVIFNSPKKINGSLNNLESNNTPEASRPTNFLSYKQANELEKILLQHREITWYSSDLEKLDEQINSEFEDITLKLFSPDSDTLSNYASDKGAYLTSDHRCDWSSSFKELKIDDKSLDSSPSNKTSIVLFLIFKEKKILFTGDVTPDRLESIIDIIRGDAEKATFDLIKLPHHGSYRSLNTKILQKIDCTKFVISTNGNKHFLPNKRAILKIINYSSSKTLDFLFNYAEVIPKLEITKSELAYYKLKLIENNNNWGYGVNY